jgi:NAD dependent epimerase/dehydratase family enzyme
MIGSALAAALNERGDEVVRFVRPDSPDTPDRSIRWDPNLHFIDEGDLERVGHLDAVVNLAGVGIGDQRWSPSRKRDIQFSRVDATTRLVAAIL